MEETSTVMQQQSGFYFAVQPRRRFAPPFTPTSLTSSVPVCCFTRLSPCSRTAAAQQRRRSRRSGLHGINSSMDPGVLAPSQWSRCDMTCTLPLINPVKCFNDQHKTSPPLSGSLDSAGFPLAQMWVEAPVTHRSTGGEESHSADMSHESSGSGGVDSGVSSLVKVTPCTRSETGRRRRQIFTSSCRRCCLETHFLHFAC